MSDLISRCELFNRLAPVQTLGEAYGIIQGMETVDAVEVVRCKYCEHHECYGGNIILFCHRHGRMVAPDYYCGDGKDDEYETD